MHSKLSRITLILIISGLCLVSCSSFSSSSSTDSTLTFPTSSTSDVFSNRPTKNGGISKSEKIKYSKRF